MIGISLNHYRITASIGAGGMGEVFRARDTRLNRDVAIKVLPKDFVADADRLRRFEQEAKTLAALNHPNVLTIHDAGVHDGAPYLVSELLEGRTLREEMSAGALALRKATDYALQIAQGLAAAHGKGVIHRDLKPENIFVTKDGRVKILDFGLAKLKAPVAADVRRLHSKSGEKSEPPHVGCYEGGTIRIDADAIINTTEPGMVLGTPAYMSPEQVRGEPADHRADIFAFGCVLYEMLSGTRAFRRNTPVESMNAVLTEEPPELASSKANVPPALKRVVRRCLEKQPENRFQTAKDLGFAIENAGMLPSSAQSAVLERPARSGWRPHLPWALTLLFAGAFLVVLFSRRQHSSRAPSTAGTAALRKFELTLPSPLKRIGTGDELHPAISPDGKKLVYANADGLWLRYLDRVGPAVRLAAGENLVTPFWSPDSLDVGYFEARKVLRVSINEGRPRLICTAPDDAGSGAAGGAWLTKDRIVFGTGWCCLYEASAQGGQFTEVDRTTEEETDFHNPSALPGGRGVLLTVHRTAGIDTIAVWTTSKTRKVLLQLLGSILFYPVYSPSGHVIFQRSDASSGIWAFPFSLDKLERTGEPFRVSDLGTLPSVSEDGTLVFSLFALDEFAPRQLAWMDRTGKLLGAFGPVLAGASQQRISPDGRRVAVAAGEAVSALDIWSIDVASGGAIPVARNPVMEASPFWWQDGRMIIFSRQDGSTSRLLAKPADGTGEEVLLFDMLQAQTGSANFSMHLSSSGKYFFAARTSLKGKITSGYFAMADPSKKFIALPAGYQETSAWCLSPDDRLLAYQSRESGQFEVYAVEFPRFTSQRTPVSRGGGRHPVWHPAANQLYYLSNDGRTLMSARLNPDGRNFEAPAKVFDLPEEIHGGFFWWPSFYDIAPDGERFLMLQKVEDKTRTNRIARPNVLVVQNWFEEFREKK